MSRRYVSLCCDAVESPADIADQDQRIGRDDFIIFPVDEEPRVHRGWLSQGLETLSIVSWDTTDAARGMNSRIADDGYSNAGIGPSMYHEIWAVARQASTDEPIPCSTYRPDRKFAFTTSLTHEAHRATTRRPGQPVTSRLICPMSRRP